MIKEKLMNALKTAAADYNGGMGANMAVACAAEAWDFNEKQAERLVEMFNTAAALKKQKDGGDPTGSCELASKEAVAKILVDGCSKDKSEKTASASGLVSPLDYQFYLTSPECTNPTKEARKYGSSLAIKQASCVGDDIPDGLDLSKGSLYKIIFSKIDLLKSASEAAGDVASELNAEAYRTASKVAKAIEDPFADPRIADMFKAACQSEKAIDIISKYSTKVADSDGGSYSRSNVFDSSLVDDLIKDAESIEKNLNMVEDFEKKRDFYMSKASDAERTMAEILGVNKVEKKASVADFFSAGTIYKRPAGDVPANDASNAGACSGDDLITKLAGMLMDADGEVGSVKSAALTRPGVMAAFTVPTGETLDVLGSGKSIPEERKIILNVRRSILLSDLMTNDPIIRDADPGSVIEAYKTMVMTSPRVSLDKSQVRAFLRGAVNSVAISPADAKVISDVDRGVAVSNVDKLTALDSSIKDSNRA